MVRNGTRYKWEVEQAPSAKSYGVDASSWITSWPGQILLTPEKEWQDYQAGVGSISMGGRGWQHSWLFVPIAEMAQFRGVPQLNNALLSPACVRKTSRSPWLMLSVLLAASPCPEGFAALLLCQWGGVWVIPHASGLSRAWWITPSHVLAALAENFSNS